MPKEIDDELKGFEDILDLFAPIKESTPNDFRDDSSFELYSFLESEILRLQKLNLFFSEKARLQKNYDQVAPLTKNLKFENAELEDRIISLIKGEDSDFFKEMNHLFNDHF